MALTVLNVAYPFAPVGPDAVGGAEQILSALDAALVDAGHRSLVLACAGSKAAGELYAAPLPVGDIDEGARAQVWAFWRGEIAAIQSREKPDLVHLHGVDFARYLPERGRTLVTLHMPLDWYDEGALRPLRRDMCLHGVSESQYARYGGAVRLLPPIGNGVDLTAHRPGGAKRNHVVFLGRICPEKGVHLAIEAAALAGAPLILAGEVFGYESHRRYFDEQVAPRLGGRARFLGPIDRARKRRWLASARCLLVPSLAEETSSLVAMEAMACGAPVVAFRRGALPDIIEQGRTGFLVDDVDEMARAILACKDLCARDCREEAMRRFSARDMTARYLALYADLASRT